MMKKFVTLALAVTLLLSVVIPVTATENIIYISPGDSLSEAIDSIKTGGTLVLRKGTYNMTDTIKLTSAYKNITIKGEGKVTITGGKEVPFSAFGKCTDTAFLDALTDQSVRNNILTVNLFDLGITDLGEIKPQGFTGPSGSGYAPTLTYEDKMLNMARYPNNGYVYTETVENLNSDSDTTYYGNHYKVNYTLSDKRYENWNSWGEIWNTSYFYVNWADTTTLAGKNDDGSLYGYTTKSYAAVKGSRLFFFNVPEEIDVPGEWYLNRETGVLYLYPDPSMKSEDVLIYSSYNKTLIDITSSLNISFENIRFCGTCAKGINVTTADGIMFDNCEFTGIGNYAVYFSKSYRSGVKNSYFHDLGSWGAYFNQCGDRTTLTSGECFVYNCHFERFSQYRRTYSPAVQTYNDVGTIISHNKFNDAPHFAIRFEANESVIEYNEFSNVCTDTADAGAVYTGRRWETRGNEIRYNYFHDITMGASSGYAIQAVYLDDCSSSTKVHGNIFYNVDRAALIGGGRHNEFSNNLIINCKASVSVDSRGTTWADPTSLLSQLNNSLKAAPYTNEYWAKEYPELQNILNDNPELPKYNVIKDNVLYSSPDMSLHNNVVTYGTIGNVYSTTDSGIFKNAENFDFKLDTNGAVFKNLPDFKDIPYDEIGLVGKGVESPRNMFITRTIFTEDYVYSSKIVTNTLKGDNDRDFPALNVTTTSGSTIAANSTVKDSAYDAYKFSFSSFKWVLNDYTYSGTFDWKKTEGQLGLQRISGKGDVTDANKPGQQGFTVSKEVPLYKGSSYTLTHTIANPENLTDDKLIQGVNYASEKNYYGIWSTINSPSAANSPFTSSSSTSATEKSAVVTISNDKTRFSYNFLSFADGFGTYSNGSRPNETGSISSFSVRLYFGDTMAYFDKSEVIETTPYSKLDVKQSLGGSATISGYSLSGTDRTQITNKTIGNESIVLESYMTATVNFTPDSGKTPYVTYNDVPLVVNNNAVSFTPSTGGLLHIQYKNSDPMVTSVMAGTPIHSTNFTTILDGTTYSSANSIIMYAMVNIGSDKIYKSSGYYVTKLDSEGNQVGEVVVLPATLVPLGDTYAVRMIGNALTAGSYKLKPYLITSDGTEFFGDEKTVTIKE